MFDHPSAHWFCCLAQKWAFDPPPAQKNMFNFIYKKWTTIQNKYNSQKNLKLFKNLLPEQDYGNTFSNIWYYLCKLCYASLWRLWKEKRRGRIDVSLKQMGLDHCLKTDQKQKMDCYITCIPFTVYLQEICFSWKKLLSSWQMKPTVKHSERGTTSSTRAQQAVRAGFPPFAFPDSFFFVRFRTFPYCYGLEEKKQQPQIFSHRIIWCGEWIRMKTNIYPPWPITCGFW